MATLDGIGFYTLRDERAANSSTTSPMWRACFIITNRCNFQCPYCNGQPCDGDFDYSLFETLVTDMVTNHRLKSIRFTGGEPTLHRRLLDMVKLSKSLGLQVAISTNGSARPELYQELVAAGVTDFSISADTADRKMAQFLAGVKYDPWERVTGNIQMLAKLVYVNLGVTVTAENVGKLPETLVYLDSLGVADMKVATSTHFKQEIPLDILNAISSEILNRHPVLKYRIEHYKAGRPVRGLIESRDNTQCPMVLDDMIVNDRGHYPCIVYARERGPAIGPLQSVAEMREARKAWGCGTSRSSMTDPICKRFCMDIFTDYNNRFKQLQGLVQLGTSRS